MILDLLCRLLVKLLLRPPSQCRQGLEPRNTQHPCRSGGTALELSGLPPDVEEHLADQAFRRRFVAYHPEYEPVHANMVPRVQHLHGKRVATCDSRDQNLVRSRLHRGNNRLVHGSVERAPRFKPDCTKFVCTCPPPGLIPVSPFRTRLGKQKPANPGVCGPLAQKKWCGSQRVNRFEPFHECPRPMFRMHIPCTSPRQEYPPCFASSLSPSVPPL